METTVSTLMSNCSIASFITLRMIGFPTFRITFLNVMKLSDGPTVTSASPRLKSSKSVVFECPDSLLFETINCIFYVLSMASLGVLDLFNVKGRVAVVTGGSSGLGLMISKVGFQRAPFRYSY